MKDPDEVALLRSLYHDDGMATNVSSSSESESADAEADDVADDVQVYIVNT